jgi:membrane-associated protease RseP (regulator of RpoE activity)
MRVTILRAGLLAALALSAASCASGYQTFYTPIDGATPDAISASRAAPAPATPKVERSQPADPETVTAAYAKRGYEVIGYSMFNSGTRENESAAIKQGQAVGADLVLIFSPQYTGSITSSMPLTTPTSTTSYTSGSATAYGPGGTTTAYGSATTTTYGSKTTYIPVTVHRSDYGAVYFVKPRFTLGAYTRDLNDDERIAMETNQGAAVLTVVDGTPAFHADILPGDIIVSIDGSRVSNAEGFSTLIREHKGREVGIELRRGDRNIQKRVQLN